MPELEEYDIDFSLPQSRQILNVMRLENQSSSSSWSTTR
jgi:hypothetical protein